MRRANDLYCTQDAQVRALLQRVEIAGIIYEPCVGHGDIAARFPARVTNDIDRGLPADTHLDATHADAWRIQCDWVVTNPPFSTAPQILPLAMATASVGVAFLLRLSFLEPVKNRGDWLAAHADQMPHLIPFGQPRPSYRIGERRPDGRKYNGDTVTTAWFVWRRDWSWTALGISCPFQFAMHWRAG